MADELKEVRENIAKRNLMLDFYRSRIDTIVHNNAELTRMRSLTPEQMYAELETAYNAFMATRDGQITLEAAAENLNLADYFADGADGVVTDEMRFNWEINRLLQFITITPRTGVSNADAFDFVFKRSADAGKSMMDTNFNFYMQNPEVRAEYERRVNEIRAQEQAELDSFIDNNRPFMKRARNRSIIWGAVAVAGIAISLGTIIPTVAVLGSVAAATGALAVGLPLLALGGAGAGLGIANIVKYTRYSRLFRHLTRAYTGTDKNGVKLTAAMLTKSVTLVHKLASKLGIAKDALPKIGILNIASYNYSPISAKLMASVNSAGKKMAAGMEKAAVATVEAGIKAGKIVVRGARKAGSAVKKVFEPTEEQRLAKDANKKAKAANKAEKAADKANRKLEEAQRKADAANREQHRTAVRSDRANTRLERKRSERQANADIRDSMEDMFGPNVDLAVKGARMSERLKRQQEQAQTDEAIVEGMQTLFK